MTLNWWRLIGIEINESPSVLDIFRFLGMQPYLRKGVNDSVEMQLHITAPTTTTIINYYYYNRNNYKSNSNDNVHLLSIVLLRRKLIN